MIETEIDGHVLIITINRPEARNAVNGDVAEGIEAAVDQLENDPDLWLGILAGAGPVFCAGADLKAIASGNVRSLGTKRGGFGGLVARERSKPLIAAVDGPALAGGTELVLACDLVIASDSARFGLPEVKRSLAAAAGGLFRLQKVLPRKLGHHVIQIGDPISAERAAAFGMVNHLCPAGEALEQAKALAGRIAVNAPLAVRESLSVLRQSEGQGEAEGFELSGQAMGRLASTEDFAEGPRAFIEKRAPEWKGR